MTNHDVSFVTSSALPLLCRSVGSEIIRASSRAAFLGALVSLPLSAATISSLEDDFESDVIDTSKWNVLPLVFPGEVGAGTYTADATTTDGVLTIDGTTSSNYWGGTMLESAGTFSSGKETTIQIDRLSLAGTGTGQRSALMLRHPDGEFLIFAHNTELAGNNWTYNYSGRCCGGNDAGVDAAGTDLGLHTMKLVFTPLGGSDVQVQMFLDGTAGTIRTFNNWDNSKDFTIAIFGSARANGDTGTAVFDNFSATTPGAPSSEVRLSVEGVGSNLRFTWNSQAGKVYDLLSSIDPEADGDPATWAIVANQEGILATPDSNVVTIARPGDAVRFYAVQERDAPAPPPVFFDDFETVQEGWTSGANGGDAGGTAWEYGSPSNVGPGSGAGGSANCYGTDLDAEYVNGTDIWLRSPVINLTGEGISSAVVSFENVVDTDGFDTGFVRVLDAGDNSPLGADVATITDFALNWTPVSQLPLPAEALGKMIRLEFQFVSDEASVFNGWYIDDVKVEVNP